jgi:hypothetical protein
MLREAKPLATIAVAACLSFGACGSSKHDPVVVRVGDHAITKARVEHWVRVEAATSHEIKPTRPLPKGLIPVPPHYADCIAYLAAEAKAAPKRTAADLKGICASKYTAFKEQVLQILITYFWIADESARKGVTVTEAEVTQYLQRLFRVPRELERFLRLTGESAADERMLARKVLLGIKLQDLVTRQAHTRAERVQAPAKYFNQLSAKWTPRTSCAAGYVVLQCKQHRGSTG